MTLLFLGSAASGLNKGVKWLSNANIFICFALLIFILILGPTQFIFETFTVAIGDYITNFVQYSLRLNPYEPLTSSAIEAPLLITKYMAVPPKVAIQLNEISGGIINTPITNSLIVLPLP